MQWTQWCLTCEFSLGIVRRPFCASIPPAMPPLATLKRPAAARTGATTGKATVKPPNTEKSGKEKTKSGKWLACNVDDDVLERMGKVFMAKLNAVNRDYLKAAKATSRKLQGLQHFSGCSGTGVSWIATNTLTRLLSGHKSEDALFAESGTKQQRFLKNCTQAHPDSTQGCIFGDIHDIAKGEGKCLRHDLPQIERTKATKKRKDKGCTEGAKPAKQCKCHLPKTKPNSVFDCGFSCKLLSKAFCNSHQSSDVCANGTGSTGDTCQGMLGSVAKILPLLVILENVS